MFKIFYYFFTLMSEYVSDGNMKETTPSDVLPLTLTLAKVEAKFVKVSFWHTTLSHFNTLI